MERIRESRRGIPLSSSPGGGFSSSSSRRRLRGTVVRESSGIFEVEDGGNDSTREQYNGQEHRSSGRTRRRLSSNENFPVEQQDEGGDGSSDESMEEEVVEDEEPIRHKSGKSKSQWKGSDEIIGVSVPRKARSASVKRLQDSVLALRPSSSSPLRSNVVPGSSPLSNSSTKANKKVVSISESEVEVAQFLYGLTRTQSHQSPPKLDIPLGSTQPEFRSSSSNQGSNQAVPRASSSASAHISFPSSSQSMPQQSSTASTAVVPKRKKARHMQSEDSGNPLVTTSNSKSSGSSVVENAIGSVPNSSAVGIGVEKELHSTKAEVSPSKPDNNVSPSDSGSSKPEASMPLVSSPQTATPIDLQQEDKPSSSTHVHPEDLVPEIGRHPSIISEKTETGSLDSARQAPVDQADQAVLKESSSSKSELPALSTPDVKLKALDNASPTSTAATGVKGVKIKIDLMALPENIYPDDDMPDVADRSVPQGSDSDETTRKGKSIVNFTEKVETQHSKLRQDHNIHDLGKKIHAKIGAESATTGKQSVAERKAGSHHNENDLEKVGNKLQSQKNQKGSLRQDEQTGPSFGIVTSASTPVLPVTIPGWPGGLPPIGYLGPSPANLSGVPSLHGAVPPNAPFITLPPARLGRCATHCYIARLIQYQQQLAKFNPFWHAAGATALYGTKPYNINILPQSNTLLFGGPVVRNPALPTNASIGSGSVVALNGYNLKDKVPSYFIDAKQPLLSQQLQQGAALISPASQPRIGGTKPSMGGTKPSGLSESTGLLSSLGTGTVSSPSANSNFSSLVATSDPKYLAMHPGNYPFPMPPTFPAHLSQQQQHLPPIFNGSFYPSQLFQLQPQSLQQVHNPATSAGSSSQNHLQVQHCFPTLKPPAESCQIEPEHAGKSEDGVHSQVPLSQKKVQQYSLPVNASFPPSFTMMVGKQNQPSDPCLRVGSKGIDVAGSVPLGQDMGNHHRYHLTGSENQQKVSGRVPLRNSEKPQMQPQLPKQATSQTKSNVSAISEPSSVTGRTAYADQISVVYSSNSGQTNLSNMQSSEWSMLSSQKVKPFSLPVNPANKKGTPQSTVSTTLSQSMQAPGPAKTQHLFFTGSEPKNQTSNVQVMFPGSIDTRKSATTNQQAQLNSSVGLTVAGTGSSYLPGSSKNPTYSPLGSSSVAVMAAASAKLPVKSSEQKPAKA